jgi:hypothetical protein
VKGYLTTLSSASAMKQLYGWSKVAAKSRVGHLDEAAYLSMRAVATIDAVEKMTCFDESYRGRIARLHRVETRAAIASMFRCNNGGTTVHSKEQELRRKTGMHLGRVIERVVTEWSENREAKDPRGAPGSQASIRRAAVGMWTGVDKKHNKGRLSGTELALAVERHVLKEFPGVHFVLGQSTVHRKIGPRSSGSNAGKSHATLAAVVLRKLRPIKRKFQVDAYASNSLWKRISFDCFRRLACTLMNFADQHTKIKADICKSFDKRPVFQMGIISGEVGNRRIDPSAQCIDHAINPKVKGAVMNANSHLVMREPGRGEQHSQKYLWDVTKEVHVFCSLEHDTGDIKATRQWNDQYDLLDVDPGLMRNPHTGEPVTEAAFASDKGHDHNMTHRQPQLLQAIYHLEKDLDRTITYSRAGGMSALGDQEDPQGAITTAIAGSPISSQFFGEARDEHVAVANRQHMLKELVSRVNLGRYAFKGLRAHECKMDKAARFTDAFRCTLVAFAKCKSEAARGRVRGEGVQTIRDAHKYISLHGYASDCTFQLLRYSCLRTMDEPCDVCADHPWRCKPGRDLPNFVPDLVHSRTEPGRIAHAEDLNDDLVPYPWVRGGSDLTFPKFIKSELRRSSGRGWDGFPEVHGFAGAVLAKVFADRQPRSDNLQKRMEKEYCLSRDDFIAYFHHRDVAKYAAEEKVAGRMPTRATKEQIEVAKGFLQEFSNRSFMRNATPSHNNLKTILELSGVPFDEDYKYVEELQIAISDSSDDIRRALSSLGTGAHGGGTQIDDKDVNEGDEVNDNPASEHDDAGIQGDEDNYGEGGEEEEENDEGDDDDDDDDDNDDEDRDAGPITPPRTHASEVDRDRTTPRSLDMLYNDEMYAFDSLLERRQSRKGKKGKNCERRDYQYLVRWTHPWDDPKWDRWIDYAELHETDSADEAICDLERRRYTVRARAVASRARDMTSPQVVPPSAYEVNRLANIERNQRYLNSLNISPLPLDADVPAAPARDSGDELYQPPDGDEDTDSGGESQGSHGETTRGIGRRTRSNTRTRSSNRGTNAGRSHDQDGEDDDDESDNDTDTSLNNPPATRTRTDDEPYRSAGGDDDSRDSHGDTTRGVGRRTRSRTRTRRTNTRRKPHRGGRR